MSTSSIILDRVQYLIDLGYKTLQSKFTTSDDFFTTSWVNPELFKEFESSSLSFILDLYGEKHPYYTNFKTNANISKPPYVEAGRGILNSIKTEIDRGWLTTIKGLVSAEIFTDFLETAEYLLEQKYKDPSAVIIGSTLEEHLRQLCRKNNLPVEDFKGSKNVPKKADTLNNDLAAAAIYNKLDQKNVTAWLDLRNKAAHGHYSEYGQEQVENLLRGVTEFMTRHSI
jgi:hypothetical protein